ncbi:uncharacterized protein LOC115956835 [Quercus lobata]|uniref:uncharacterized protein LOC115956835 n=1 Tax=Quercus lobata TaxID=97700 RepID=UPI001244B797|nr:uncharacterized protein LOC115956835 [Quercus lobata]
MHGEGTPSNSAVSSDDEGDVSYRRRSRTLPSESFSYDEEHHHKRRTGSCPSRVLSVARLSAEDLNSEPKKARVGIRPTLSFSNEDKMGTIQPHDDALVVTLKIGGYDVKRVMVDQGSGAKIMYPDLYIGLNLKLGDLTAYDSPLVSFHGKVVIPKGEIRLPVQADSEVVEVDFIVVDAYSPYMAIVARP